MKKNLLFVALSALFVVSCSGIAGDGGKVTKSLEIEIESGGGVYTFPEADIASVVAPNDYYAEVKNNTFVGVFAGETTATVASADTEYECKIKVTPSFTYYIDMAIYLGQTQSSIEALYGEAVSTSNGISMYNPLASYLPETAVAFIYEDGKVASAVSYFELSKGMNVIEHLQQRYATYGTEDNVGYFGNAFDLEDCSIVVFYNFASSDFTFVMYANYSSSDSKSKAIYDANIERYNRAFSSAISTL